MTAAINGPAVGVGATMTLAMDIRLASDTLTGRVLPAQEALDGGLVSRVLPADELLPAAHALAREIADNAAPVSVALTRQRMWRGVGPQHPMEAHRIDSLTSRRADGPPLSRATPRHRVTDRAARRR